MIINITIYDEDGYLTTIDTKQFVFLIKVHQYIYIQTYIHLITGDY